MKNIVKKIIEGCGAYFFKSYFIKKKNEFNPIDQFIFDESQESYKTFKKYFANSMLFKRENLPYAEKIRKFSINKALEINQENNNSFFLEFGVFKGQSTNLFAKILSSYEKKLFCFDSFQGLSSDWKGTSFAKGQFSLKKENRPKLPSNVEIIEGDIFETLDIFLKDKKSLNISFIHFDLDIYDVTKFSLEKIKPYLNKNSVLLFDQIHHVQGWKNEYKALTEVFNENEYEFIAFSEDGQASLKIK